MLFSDTVPKFDMAKECRYEGGYISDIDRCSRDEATALKQLKNEWGRFVGTDKRTCMMEATIGGLSSYVELLTCLEIASVVRNEVHHPRDRAAGTESPAATWTVESNCRRRTRFDPFENHALGRPSDKRLGERR